MRNLQRNLTDFQYRAYAGMTEILSDGRRTGQMRPGYGMAVEMRGVISPARGNAYTSAFGNFADYSHVILVNIPDIEIDEQGLILMGTDTYIVQRVSRSKNVTQVAVKKVTVDGQTY